MARIEIAGHGTWEVATGERLVLAIEGCGIDIGHRCGGYARCTTCRVRFTAGAPTRMTVAERDKLAERDLLGEVRLSCQCLAADGMKLAVLMRVSEQGWTDPGPAPEPQITPLPEWVPAADAPDVGA